MWMTAEVCLKKWLKQELADSTGWKESFCVISALSLGGDHVKKKKKKGNPVENFLESYLKSHKLWLL